MKKNRQIDQLKYTAYQEVSMTASIFFVYIQKQPN